MILRDTAKQRYLNILERKHRCLSDFLQLVRHCFFTYVICGMWDGQLSAFF